MNCPFFMRYCTKCNKLLIVCELYFVRDKKGKYGFGSKCKDCISKYKKEYRKNNIEKAQEFYEKTFYVP